MISGTGWGFAPGPPSTLVAAVRQIRDCLCNGREIMAEQAVAPSFSPAPGDYDEPQTVTLSSPTPNATFFYTVNGGTPDEGSTPYTGPIQISYNLTLKAITVAQGYLPSNVTSGDYDVDPQVVATPTFSPPGGSYNSTQAVVISTTTPGAQTYYTDDGSPPDSGSTLVTGPVTVSADVTLQAVSIKTGFEDSQIASAAYTITAAAVVAPTITFNPSGTQEFIFSDEPNYPASFIFSMSTTTPGADIYYVEGVQTDHQPTDADNLYFAPGSALTSTQFRAIAKLGTEYSAVTSRFHLIETPVFWGWAATDDLDSSGIRALTNRVVRYIHSQTYPTFEYLAPTGTYTFETGSGGSDYFYIAIPESYPTPVSIKLGSFNMPMAGTTEGYTENDGNGGPNYMLVEVDTGINYKLMRTFNAVGGSETDLILA